MFTMAKIKDGGTYLERHLAANDYYSENESVVGSWIGRGARRLGQKVTSTLAINPSKTSEITDAQTATS
jgi:hypothetical protein